jgi:hypothetical protein
MWRIFIQFSERAGAATPGGDERGHVPVKEPSNNLVERTGPERPAAHEERSPNLKQGLTERWAEP